MLCLVSPEDLLYVFVCGCGQACVVFALAKRICCKVTGYG